MGSSREESTKGDMLGVHKIFWEVMRFGHEKLGDSVVPKDFFWGGRGGGKGGPIPLNPSISPGMDRVVQNRYSINILFYVPLVFLFCIISNFFTRQLLHIKVIFFLFLTGTTKKNKI